jgi:5-methyltetrahydropteroyltriglutamate--homocysteine methyltransferase
MATPARITIPTEPIGSLPRPADLIERVAKADSEDPNLAPLYKNAIRDTMKRFEATGSVDPRLGPRKKCAPFVRTRQELALLPGRRVIFN